MSQMYFISESFSQSCRDVILTLSSLPLSFFPLALFSLSLPLYPPTPLYHHLVLLSSLSSSSTHSAIITTINHDEVWFKRLDGSKSKLYISQLQKGKYTIKHS